MIRYGFILLHRSLLDWEWYQNPNVLRLFLHLLLTVNYEDKQYCGMTIKRGQRLVSYAKLCDELGMSLQQLRTALKKLKSTQEITQLKECRHSLITVTKFEEYQQVTEKATAKQPDDNRAMAVKQHGSNNNVINRTKQNKEKKKQSFAEGASFDLDTIEELMRANVLQGISEQETGGMERGKETA